MSAEGADGGEAVVEGGIEEGKTVEVGGDGTFVELVLEEAVVLGGRSYRGCPPPFGRSRGGGCVTWWADSGEWRIGDWD